MNRYDCFEFLAPLIKDQLVIGSLSGQRVEWGHLCRHEGNLLVASMGAALASRWSCPIGRSSCWNLMGACCCPCTIFLL